MAYRSQPNEYYYYIIIRPYRFQFYSHCLHFQKLPFNPLNVFKTWQMYILSMPHNIQYYSEYIFKQTTPSLSSLTLQFPLFLNVIISLCESVCCRVALKESGCLDSYVFALSFFVPFDSGSDWSKFNAAGLVGKVCQEEVLQTWLVSSWLSVECLALEAKEGEFERSQIAVNPWKRLGIEVVDGFSLLALLFFFFICLCVLQDRSDLRGAHRDSLTYMWFSD